MPDGIIRDPKMNVDKEADFGVLFVLRTDKSDDYFLYFKEDLNSNKDKRYFTSGTVVNFTGEENALKKNYHWDKILIKKWVNIEDEPDDSTGNVVKQINKKVKKALTFPDEKEHLSEYL